MMQRNRKRASLHGGMIAKSLLACVYIAGIGLGYVWYKNQIYRLGDELKKREAALATAEKRNAMLAAQLAHLKSPAYLEARMQQSGLSLVTPREAQTVRVYEPSPAWEAQLLERQLAEATTAPATRRQQVVRR